MSVSLSSQVFDLRNNNTQTGSQLFCVVWPRPLSPADCGLVERHEGREIHNLSGHERWREGLSSQVGIVLFEHVLIYFL